MSELSRALGGEGPPFKLILKNKTYNVGLINQDVKVAYEKDLYAKSIESVSAMRAHLAADDYKGMMQELASRFTRGDFAMEGKEGKELFNTPRGVLLITSLLLGVDGAEAMRVMMEDEAQVLAVIQSVMSESFPGVSFEEGGDPKAKAG